MTPRPEQGAGATVLPAGPASSPPPRVPLVLLGARGLLGGELLRLLETHPTLAVSACGGRSGADLGATHPHVARGWSGPVGPHIRSAPEAEDDLAAALSVGPAALVLALPAGESAPAWQRLRARLGPAAGHLVVADLSPDYRLRSARLHREAYGEDPRDPEGREAFAYGLPELFRDRLRHARRVAVPGCFATALQLAVVPAAREGVLDDASPWFFSGVTGSSGSGIEPKPGTHHPHRHGNLWAYGLAGHRHEAELLQALEGTDLRPGIRFLPHSGPYARGIHLTACLPLARPLAPRDAHGIYARAFAGEPFVEVLGDAVPDLRRVAGSNTAALRAFVRDRTLHVLVTLDNLVKGGAGAALQCLNLMLGLPEVAGLPRSGLGVC